MWTALISAWAKKHWAKLAAVGAALLALLTAYFKGRESGAAKGQRVADKATAKSKGLEDELKQREIYDEHEARIRHEADVKRAALDTLGLRNRFPDSGVIELHAENGKTANIQTSTDLQLDRD